MKNNLILRDEILREKYDLLSKAIFRKEFLREIHWIHYVINHEQKNIKEIKQHIIFNHREN